MNNQIKVSNAVLRRLPRYRRYLGDLKSRDVRKISSYEFSKLIGYTASQIRQDFNTFGGFGQQGYGYSVEYLYKEISKILGLDRDYKAVIVGIGNLGQAITNHTYFYKNGFNIIGLFDINPKVVGLVINGIQVQDYSCLADYVRENNIDIGVICANKTSAQDIADTLVKSGCRGIWNFAPVDIKVKEGIAVENVHLSDSLHTLIFKVKQDSENQENKKQ